MTCSTDIDYEPFPIADLDLHWIQLPNSVLAASRQSKLLALAQARVKTLPIDHKVFLVPAQPFNPTRYYSPTEAKLTAPGQLREKHCGWRNPFPANFEMPSPPKAKK